VKTIRYSLVADRKLAKLPIRVAARIEAKIDQFAIDPSSLSANVKALRGSVFIRLRVDNYRIIMDDQGVVLDILDIGHRKEIYR
jgi:mRNA interferase RelE/StbE